MRGQLSLWRRFQVAVMLGQRAFRKGFAVSKPLYMMKGDKLTVTYTLEIN